MKSYRSFIFDSYHFDPTTGEVTLRYSLDDEVTFAERLTLPLPPSPIAFNHAALEASLFALHLIGGISYYKTCLPNTIIVRSGTLSRDQAEWWNTVYTNGLGEFFFRNKIDSRNLISFPWVEGSKETKDTCTSKQSPKHHTSRCLVPIGGGKDSIVTVELLKKAGFPVTLFRMEPHPIIDALATVAELPMLTAKRTLDPLLFQLNADGAYNGHIPISAYLSLVTVTLSILHGFDAVVMSNERSANAGNVEYLGSTINHQWSKSLEFESLFQQYCSQFITKSLNHFSLLRPLSELHIGRMFSLFPQYFPFATSCNTNWKILKTDASTERWCRHCPKCAFVFAVMAAFLPKSALQEMFGSILFDDASLIPLYRELLNIEGFKPFECVGTPQETLAALVLAHERGELQETPVMRMAMEEASLPEDLHELIITQFTPSRDHLIPTEFQSILSLNQ